MSRALQPHPAYVEANRPASEHAKPAAALEFDGAQAEVPADILPVFRQGNPTWRQGWLAEGGPLSA